MKIAFCVGSRANWGSCKSVVKHCARTAGLSPQVLLFGSALSERYTGATWDLSEDVRIANRDRIPLESPTHIEPTTPLAAARAAALALGSFDFTGYDLVYVVGDRYEVLAPAYAATIQGVRIAHQMGGEVSGNIDEHIRHAITKLAHVHFVANVDAQARVIGLGEDPLHVYVTGCPRMDLIREAEPATVLGPFAMVMLHPEAGFIDVVDQALTVLVERNFKQVAWFWPNCDPGGSIGVEKAAVHRLERLGVAVSTYRGLPPEQFYPLLKACSLFVGNSSVAVRDCAFAGVPAELVGHRQDGRLRSENFVSGVDQAAGAITFESRPASYGDGTAGAQIANILATRELPPVQKRMR